MSITTRIASTNEEIRAHNQQVIDTWYQLLKNKNLDAWMDCWHENSVQYIPYAPDGFPNSVSGKANLEAVYRDLFAGYGRLEFQRIDIQPMLEPNLFVVEWEVEIELTQTGGTYQNRLLGLYRFPNGKVIEFTEYFNPLNFLKASKRPGNDI